MIMILLLAFGLAMDAFAVSISCGMCVNENNKKNLMLMGLVFGLFQGGMIALGWLLGDSFKHLIESVDHWIAAGLLYIIGIKMIKEAFGAKKCKTDMLSFKMLMVLGIATSIDALAAGISLSLVNQSLWIVAVTVGLVTMFMSYIGAFVISKIFEKINISKYVEVLGGVILILIGCNILWEHLK